MYEEMMMMKKVAGMEWSSSSTYFGRGISFSFGGCLLLVCLSCGYPQRLEGNEL